MSVSVTNPWQCEKCGHRIIIERSAGAEVETQVCGLNERGQLIYGQHAVTDIGGVKGYECQNCEEPVRDGVERITARQRLVEFLARLAEEQKE